MSTNDVEEIVSSEDSSNEKNTNILDTLIRSWALPFVGFGVFGGLPIPCGGLIFLILSIGYAIKLGWTKGLLGVGLFFGTAVFTRVVLILVLSGSSGN